MVKVFLSYSHRDDELKVQLEVHLGILAREGIIEPWSDRRIGAGQDVHAAIGDSLETADIVLLLVSPDFLASDYCFEIEMKRALARHQAGSARIIPVILRSCDWQHSPFGHLRATPKDGVPISRCPDRDEAFLQVSRDIRSAAREIRAARQVKKPAAPRLEIPAAFQARSELPRDHGDFARTSFNIVATIFETEMAKLGRSKRRQAEFLRLNDDTLEASYTDEIHGRMSCTVKRVGAEILYMPGPLPLPELATEAFSVTQDPLSGLPLLRSRTGKELLALFAAGHLWTLFTGRSVTEL
jgi:hypothetical protein